MIDIAQADRTLRTNGTNGSNAFSTKEHPTWKYSIVSEDTGGVVDTLFSRFDATRALYLHGYDTHKIVGAPLVN